MSGFELKSSQFRREREASWRELEQLIEQIEGGGVGQLSAEQLWIIAAAVAPAAAGRQGHGRVRIVEPGGARGHPDAFKARWFIGACIGQTARAAVQRERPRVRRSTRMFVFGQCLGPCGGPKISH